MAKPTKTETITIRATAAIKKLAEKHATAAHRSIAGHLAYLIEENGGTSAGKQSNRKTAP